MRKLIDVDELKDYISGLISAQYADINDTNYYGYLRKRGYIHCAEDITDWIEKHEDKYWHDMADKPGKGALVSVLNDRGDYAIRPSFMLDGLYPKAVAWGYVPDCPFPMDDEGYDE